jgi:ankyrin repeat protein
VEEGRRPFSYPLHARYLVFEEYQSDNSFAYSSSQPGRGGRFPDKCGRTPLHEASRFGHLEISRMLVDHGANANARQQNHWTSLQLSVQNGHLGIPGLNVILNVEML